MFGGSCGGVQALLHFFQAAGGFLCLQLPDHSGGGGAVIVLHPTGHHPCGIVVRGLLESKFGVLGITGAPLDHSLRGEVFG